MDLQTEISRFGDQPAYGIYECGACDHIEWVQRT
jgi:hypothetical protein